MNLIEELEKVLRAKAAKWTEPDRELVREAAADILRLFARQAAGEDVDDELEIARASAQQIKAAGKVTGASIIGEWLAKLAAVGKQFLLEALA